MVVLLFSPDVSFSLSAPKTDKYDDNINDAAEVIIVFINVMMDWMVARSIRMKSLGLMWRRRGALCNNNVIIDFTLTGIPLGGVTKL